MTLVGREQVLRTNTTISRDLWTLSTAKIARPARLWYVDALPIRRAGAGSCSRVLGRSELGSLLASGTLGIPALPPTKKASIVRAENLFSPD